MIEAIDYSLLRNLLLSDNDNNIHDNDDLDLGLDCDFHCNYHYDKGHNNNNNNNDIGLDLELELELEPEVDLNLDLNCFDMVSSPESTNDTPPKQEQQEQEQQQQEYDEQPQHHFIPRDDDFESFIDSMDFAKEEDAAQAQGVAAQAAAAMEAGGNDDVEDDNNDDESDGMDMASKASLSTPTKTKSKRKPRSTSPPRVSFNTDTVTTPPPPAAAAATTTDPTTTTSSTTAGNDDVGPNDIVCGRDKLSHAHIGNKMFRRVIEQNRERYQTATSRETKTRITAELVNKFCSAGRFLKKDDVTGMWSDVGEEYAREKVSHALRSAKDPNRIRVRKKRKVVKREFSEKEERVFNDLLNDQQSLFGSMVAQYEEEQGGDGEVVSVAQSSPAGQPKTDQDNGEDGADEE